MLESRKMIKDFTDIIAWQKGHEVVLSIYKITEKFPKEEVYGLTSQMRRCAVSITSNIAEGFSRNSSKEKDQFYAISSGSYSELKNQLLVAKDLNIIAAEEYTDVSEKIKNGHMILNGLRRANRAKQQSNVNRQRSNV